MRVAKKLKWGLFITAGIFLPLLLLLRTDTVFGGDGGDLVTTAFVHGVAHPPGYPLYTLIAFLLTKLTFLGSVAGRVNYLSTIPAILSLPILCTILYFHTRRLVVSLIGTCVFGFNYIFLLLAAIPEVFALHLLFVLLIMLLLILWKEKKSINYFYAAVFVFGLALSHHHTILFLIPAFAYFIYSNRRNVHFFPYTVYGIRYTGSFLLGLLPYLYVYFAARTDPVINWENPQTMQGFIRLLSRAVYGTFQSGIAVGWSFQERLVHLKLFYQSVIIDFTHAGVVLGIIGALYLFLRYRKEFYFFFLAFFFSGPLFVYYASFPLGNNFYLGTVERFYLIPYLFLAIFIAYGVIGFQKGFNWCMERIHLPRGYPVAFLFLLYPFILGATTVPKLVPLRTDYTAENVAYDVLRTTTPNSLLLLTEDTRLFNTEYIYFTSGTHYETQLIHFGLLAFPFYTEYVGRHYPQIVVPEAPDYKTRAQQFIKENAMKFTLYADYPYEVGDAFRWVPKGILWELYPKDAAFDKDEYLSENNRLFASYQDLLSGALGRYTHVMLADTLRVYSNGRFEVGKALVKLGFIKESQEYFSDAFRLNSENPDTLIELIGTQILLKECSEAEEVLKKATARFPKAPSVFTMGASLFTRCFNDAEKAAEYEKRYKELLQSNQPSLEQL